MTFSPGAWMPSSLVHKIRIVKAALSGRILKRFCRLIRLSSVPVLTFVSCRGGFIYECQNQRDTRKHKFLVEFSDLTFAWRTRGEPGSECQIHSTSRGKAVVFAVSFSAQALAASQTHSAGRLSGETATELRIRQTGVSFPCPSTRRPNSGGAGFSGGSEIAVGSAGLTGLAG